MKIVQFEDFFHPDAGYNINILSKYLVKLGHEVVIVTSEIEKSPFHLKSFFDCENISEKDRQFEESTGVKIYRIHTYFFYSSRAVVKYQLFEVLAKFYPDIIYIHGNDTFVGILATLLYKKYDSPIIYDSSMVEMASINRLNWLFRGFYRIFITPKFLKNDIKVIRTQDDNYVQKHLGIPLSNAPYISLGVDTDLFKPVYDFSTLRKEIGLPLNAYVIIYAGKIELSKGILTLIDAWDEFVNDKRFMLLLIGNVNPEVSEKFHEFLKKNPDNIIHLPTQKYNDLAKFYQLSNLAVFPRQISLSFFNAQACGLPVVAESNNINDERLSHGNGLVFEYDNPRDFYQKINQIIDMTEYEYKKMSDNAKKFISSGYDFNNLIHRYLNLFESEISDFKLN